jgi:predicted transcriptional regulator
MADVGEEHRTFHWGADQPADRPGVTVSEAAEVLGITPEAVRMRIKRGTLHSEKRGNRVYVLLGPRPTTEQTTEQTTDHTEELIATLREQLAAERQAHAEARRIIAGLVERIPPQLEASSQEPPGGPQTASEEPERTEPLSNTPGPQERVSRPWWRRVFGG